MENRQTVETLAGAGATVLLCEHAGHDVPLPLQIDPRLLASHRGYDIGIAWVTRKMAALLDGPAVLCLHSRLLCDVNRKFGQADCIPAVVDGQELPFNRALSDDALAERRRLYDAYHRAVDRCVDASPFAQQLISLHSFTPVLGEQRREMELGLLYDRWPERAARLARILSDLGFIVAHNAPYSGAEGKYIYSVWRAGRRANLPYLEIEIRQDLIADQQAAEAVAERLVEALEKLGLNIP
ncbi:MAG: N-formylglutamate amidohydrolase [Deltaproteobacteria bacterium]|nr:N-formylglutamate amidohydrolase [Deltaproteobacteria bacterium]